MIPSQHNAGSNPNLINPVFPGGLVALNRFVEQERKHHSSFRTGTVFVEFVVNTHGSVSDIVVLKGLGVEADTEATRIVSSMPNWQAGTLNGEPVRVKFVLPISFSS